MRAQAAMLPDRRRLHLQDGPIDLIVEALGASEFVAAAYSAAAQRFGTVLDELCSELGELRTPFRPERQFHGPIARRMQNAVAPYGAETFITPMAAVAGSVAEDILRAMTAAAPLRRASVNNGGDIAVHLAPGESVRVGLVDRPDLPGLFGTATIRAEDAVRGIATSGWRGRSFSFGIADAATVLAEGAAAADAAATIVANAVDLPGHPGVVRVAAGEVQCDSDLGERLVTRGVEPLATIEIHQALARGLACAERLVDRGLIRAAALHLQGETRVLGELAASWSDSARPSMNFFPGRDAGQRELARASPPATPAMTVGADP